MRSKFVNFDLGGYLQNGIAGLVIEAEINFNTVIY